MTRRSLFQAVVALMPWRKSQRAVTWQDIARMNHSEFEACLDAALPEYALYKRAVVHLHPMEFHSAPGQLAEEYREALRSARLI